MTSTKPRCPRCDRVHVGTDVRAVGVFDPDTPTRYAVPAIGPHYLWSTRADAEAALCDWHTNRNEIAI